MMKPKKVLKFVVPPQQNDLKEDQHDFNGDFNTVLDMNKAFKLKQPKNNV